MPVVALIASVAACTLVGRDASSGNASAAQEDQASAKLTWKSCNAHGTQRIFDVEVSEDGRTRYSGGADVRHHESIEVTLNAAAARRMIAAARHAVADANRTTSKSARKYDDLPPGARSLCFDITVRQGDGTTQSAATREGAVSQRLEKETAKILPLKSWICPHNELVLEDTGICPLPVITFGILELQSCRFVQIVRIYQDGATLFEVRKRSQYGEFVHGPWDLERYSQASTEQMQKLFDVADTYNVDWRFGNLESGMQFDVDGRDYQRYVLESFKSTLTDVLKIEWTSPPAGEECWLPTKNYPSGYLMKWPDRYDRKAIDKNR